MANSQYAHDGDGNTDDIPQNIAAPIDPVDESHEHTSPINETPKQQCDSHQDWHLGMEAEDHVSRQVHTDLENQLDHQNRHDDDHRSRGRAAHVGIQNDKLINP